jgi:SnoaL-like domain
MNLEELAARVQNLEDIEAIKRLKARYCGYCDNGYEPDGIASLFTEEAVWDGGVFGKSVGREAIRKFFQGASKLLPFALHYVMNPIIEVNGNTGKGTWYLFQTCTFAEGNQAVWGAAKYSEEYVKVNGEWKFKNLKVNSEFWTPYDQGWVKKRFVQDK